MKKLLSVNNSSGTTDISLLIARIGIAALMLTHGLPKLIMLLSGAQIHFPSVMGMSAGLSLGLTVFAEVFCSILILAGFATRIAVVPLFITMLVAVLFIHADDPFSKQEPAIQYLLVYAVLLIAGSGKYSLDYLFQGKKSPAIHSGRKIQDPTLAIYQ